MALTLDAYASAISQDKGLSREDALNSARGSSAYYDPAVRRFGISEQLGQLLAGHVSGTVLDPDSAWQVTKILAHEVEHAVTPTRHSDSPRPWLEEASAELLARDPARVERAAQRMGITATFGPNSAANDAANLYDPYVKSLDVWLGAAGIDTTRGLSEARELLQSNGDQRVVAQQLGSRIATHLGARDPAAGRDIASLFLTQSGPNEIHSKRLVEQARQRWAPA